MMSKSYFLEANFIFACLLKKHVHFFLRRVGDLYRDFDTFLNKKKNNNNNTLILLKVSISTLDSLLLLLLQ